MKMPSFNDNPSLYITIITLAICAIGYPLLRRSYRRAEQVENPNCRCVVIPAAFLDASDTTPMPEQTNTYCLACWLEWIGKPQRNYFAPEGIAAFCERHAYMTLARALSAQQQQRETGDRR